VESIYRGKPNGNHGLQPWLYSDAPPRLLSSHPEFLDIRSSEFRKSPAVRETPASEDVGTELRNPPASIAAGDLVVYVFAQGDRFSFDVYRIKNVSPQDRRRS